jgi:S-adenosylmethionine-diacylglycerol 3-amino-3-carboxypropyl transferase
MSALDWLSGRVFKYVHGNNLVYNTCWEDPRLDRVALQIGPEDDILVITSAGCNALDYALCEPNHVYAVDMNPRQNALLDLKKAAIKSLEWDDFFRMFGDGRLPGVANIYRQKMRTHLSPWSRAYWDKYIGRFFDSKRPFYFRGTSGSFARWMKLYTDHIVKVRPNLDAALNSKSLAEQQEIYYKQLKDRFWTGLIRFLMDRDTTLSLLGVPRAQRRQIETQYKGGVVKFIEDCVEAVFAKLPLADNYFWRVYMTGSYTRSCCPEYLKPQNFSLLKAGLVDRITTHTDSVQAFLERHDGSISRFVLLDHMDWLAHKLFPILELEWQAILERAAPETRIIWRSGGLRTDFLQHVEVTVDGEQRRLPELLTMRSDLAEELHEKDRVHTYGSFYIADLAPAPKPTQRVPAPNLKTLRQKVGA